MKYLKNQVMRKDLITKVQICKLLSEQFDVYADQRTVKDDINCLLSMGYIACDSKNSYHYTMHSFKDWELKMLIDGIAQTDYFEPRTLNHIIEKIIALASPTDAEMLHRNSPVFNYTVKDCDLYLSENLSRIVHAIKELHPIKFEYFKLDENKVPVPYHNGIYTVHPYAILKRNAFYYLVSYSDGRFGSPLFSYGQKAECHYFGKPKTPFAFSSSYRRQN